MELTYIKKICANCAFYYQHYLKGGVEVYCGHCSFHKPVKNRKKDYFCDKWTSRKEQEPC